MDLLIAFLIFNLLVMTKFHFLPVLGLFYLFNKKKFVRVFYIMHLIKVIVYLA